MHSGDLEAQSRRPITLLWVESEKAGCQREEGDVYISEVATFFPTSQKSSAANELQSELDTGSNDSAM